MPSTSPIPVTMEPSWDEKSTRKACFESHPSEALPPTGITFSIRWGSGSVAFNDPSMLWSAGVAKSEEASTWAGWRSLLLQVRQNTLSSLLYLLQNLQATSLDELKPDRLEVASHVRAYCFSLTSLTALTVRNFRGVPSSL